MTRVAAIDCGTNSVRLLIAEPTGAGLADVLREMRIVRLGQDVDRTGRLAPAALERTRAALAEYAAAIDDAGATVTRMVATSATRDAANRDEFTAMVRGVLGVEPEVITGTEEAALSFAGAVAGLPGAARPLLVADIGGGSTELVLGARDGAAGLRASSMEVGSVRMTERHLHDDPPTPAQVAAATADVDAAIARAGDAVPLHEARTFVGLAGTVTTLAAITLGLTVYDSVAVHGSTLTRDQIAELSARLLAMTRAERSAIPVIHPGRIDVIAGGALILDRLVAATDAGSVLVSEHDILDGIALGLTAGEPTTRR